MLTVSDLLLLLQLHLLHLLLLYFLLLLHLLLLQLHLLSNSIFSTEENRSSLSAGDVYTLRIPNRKMTFDPL